MRVREGGRERGGERERERGGFKLLVHNCKNTYNSDDSEKHDDSKSEESNEGIGLDVGVPILIHFHQYYTTSDEHEGSVYKHKIKYRV